MWGIGINMPSLDMQNQEVQEQKPKNILFRILTYGHNSQGGASIHLCIYLVIFRD